MPSQPPLRRCLHCNAGFVVLFTSVRVCDRCLGSGVDLLDERFMVPIAELNTMVRTRKLLAKMGIHTLSQLIRAACLGHLAGLEESSPTVFCDLIGLQDRWDLSRIMTCTDQSAHRRF